LCTVLYGVSTPGRVALAHRFGRPLRTRPCPGDTNRIAQELSAKYGGTLGFVYSAGIRGFAVRVTDANADELAGEPAVDYVAQNQAVGLTDVQVQLSPPSWGIDRIDG